MEIVLLICPPNCTVAWIFYIIFGMLTAMIIEHPWKTLLHFARDFLKLLTINYQNFTRFIENLMRCSTDREKLWRNFTVFYPLSLVKIIFTAFIQVAWYKSQIMPVFQLLCRLSISLNELEIYGKINKGASSDESAYVRE